MIATLSVCPAKTCRSHGMPPGNEYRAFDRRSTDPVTGTSGAFPYPRARRPRATGTGATGRHAMDRWHRSSANGSVLMERKHRVSATDPAVSPTRTPQEPPTGHVIYIQIKGWRARSFIYSSGFPSPTRSPAPAAPQTGTCIEMPCQGVASQPVASKGRGSLGRHPAGAKIAFIYFTCYIRRSIVERRRVLPVEWPERGSAKRSGDVNGHQGLTAGWDYTALAGPDGGSVPGGSGLLFRSSASTSACNFPTMQSPTYTLPHTWNTPSPQSK